MCVAIHLVGSMSSNVMIMVRIATESCCPRYSWFRVEFLFLFWPEKKEDKYLKKKNHTNRRRKILAKRVSVVVSFFFFVHTFLSNVVYGIPIHTNGIYVNAPKRNLIDSQPRIKFTLCSETNVRDIEWTTKQTYTHFASFVCLISCKRN